MSKVAILQSNYIPWKGYFDIIDDVDKFIFYDDVQYTKNDWRNRNRIKTANGPIWLTVPCGQRINRRICDVRISDTKWQDKHWQSIRQSYGKAPGFQFLAEFLEDFYCARDWDLLSDMNRFFIKSVSNRFLDIDTEFLDSRNFELNGAKQDRIMTLLKKVGATSYVSGPAATAYIDDSQFQQSGIELIWKNYDGYAEYPQLHPPYDHYVSIIDLICHTAGHSRAYLKPIESEPERAQRDCFS